MCLAIPMKIKRIVDSETAVVTQGETELEVNTALLENPSPGDYIIVHAGFAIEKLEYDDAQDRLELFDSLDGTNDATIEHD